jgi:VanZ family protein
VNARIASVGWIGLILFSSTSVAGEWSERAYAWIYAAVFGASKTQGTGTSLLHFVAEKCVHLTLFFVLGLLLSRVVFGRMRFGKVVLGGLIVGTASEILQRFFPGRDPAVRDVFINVVGTALGAAVVIGDSTLNSLFRRN